MEFKFRPIQLDDVKQIHSWNYDGFIEKVMMTPYFESFDLKGELRGPGGCEGYAALLEDDVAGLFEFTKDDRVIWIGLALRPDLIGKGLGDAFVKQGIAFGVQHYEQNIEEIRLEVDVENKAAIRVYEKIGFSKMEQKGRDLKMQLIL